MLSHRWHAVAESQFPWEREALDYLRQHLPDAETTRAWANGEFISLDGRLYEADVIVITARGMFLVEIKSRPGEVFLHATVRRSQELPPVSRSRHRNPVTKAAAAAPVVAQVSTIACHRP
jgi:hypothetical protein